MDLTLGIFIGIFLGIGIAVSYGQYLNERGKKGVPKNSNPPPPPPKEEGLFIYIDGKKIAALNSTPFPIEKQEVTSKETSFTFQHLFKIDKEHLEQMIQLALEREDYQEAARLRDLMNKR